MKDKNLLPDNNDSTIEELTDQANQIVESLENEKDLNNSVESYQQLLKLNNIIEKKFKFIKQDIVVYHVLKIYKFLPMDFVKNAFLNPQLQVIG